VSGDFTEELGEDFFGFKELGLDKEFGMISLSVPLRLLQGRMRAVINPSGGDGGHETAEQEYPDPPPWEPVTIESIDLEVGLIHHFFLDKLSKSELPYLIEDENLPVKQRLAKPRLPPSGKINTPRKRKDVPSTSASAKKKKKSTKPPPPEPPPQLPTPPMAMIREEEGSDVESLFG
jgi:transcriptional activator SPT7